MPSSHTFAAAATGCAAAFIALAAVTAAGIDLPGDVAGTGPYVAAAVSIGSRHTLGVAIGVAVLVAVWRRDVALGLLAVAVGAAVAVGDRFLKPLIGREDVPGAPLFPSGHASASAAVAVLAVAVVWRCTTSPAARRAGAVTASAVGVVGVAAAVISGGHYVTDAVGSVLWIGAVAATWAAAAHLPARP